MSKQRVGNPKMSNEVNLGQGSVGKLLLKLAVPSITAQIINLLYNLVDRMYIGHLPEVGAAALTGVWPEETGKIEDLWNGLHFNEFHDTMGGTTIKPAREEAVMQLSAVCAKAASVRETAKQRIVNSLDTSGEG